MKNIKDLLKEKLIWVQDPTMGIIFISEQYPKEECYLRMNDFPDEPFWTLFYRGERIDFDDDPQNWTIKYTSQ